MAEFTQDQTRVHRFFTTLRMGDTTASFCLPRGARSSSITMQFNGSASVSHTVSGTIVEVKNIVANETYHNTNQENTFTFTPGIDVFITIDVNRR